MWLSQPIEWSPMRLYAERKRQEQLEGREAAGENVWTDELSEPVRRKLWYTLEACINQNFRDEILGGAQKVVRQSLGLAYLTNSSLLPPYDVREAILEGGNGLVFSVLEACIWAMGVDPPRYGTEPGQFETSANRIFASHRVSVEIVEGEVVPFDSQELHTEIVAPTLRLLSGRQGWEAVEDGYQKALKEIGDDPSDAITDAGTTLQEALTVRGCEGNALGALVKDAKRKGILAPHDPTLSSAISKLIDWVAADRSEKGDGHRSLTGATPEDAWLAVHVVGALILRLAGDSARSQV